MAHRTKAERTLNCMPDRVAEIQDRTKALLTLVRRNHR
jgi:hypothetical protein